MNVTRFFHIHPDFARKSKTRTFAQKHKYRGATIMVSGNTEYVGQVDVQVSFCSKKDEFDKKIGRREAEKAPIKVVQLRYLPRELARIEAEVYGYALDNQSDFLYSIPYFLPKE